MIITYNILERNNEDEIFVANTKNLAHLQDIYDELVRIAARAAGRNLTDILGPISNIKTAVAMAKKQTLALLLTFKDNGIVSHYFAMGNTLEYTGTIGKIVSDSRYHTEQSFEGNELWAIRYVPDGNTIVLQRVDLEKATCTGVA